MKNKQPETCSNPFFKCTSNNPTDIYAIIRFNGKDYPICRECWRKIAKSNIEW